MPRQSAYRARHPSLETGLRASKRYIINALSNWCQIAISTTCGIVILPYAVTRLGEDRFGLYAIVGSLLNILMLLDLGLTGAISRFSAQDQSQRDLDALRATLSTGLLVLGTVGTLGAASLMVALPWIRSFYHVPPEHYGGLTAITCCMAVSFLLRFLSVPPSGALTGAERYELMNAFESLGNLVRLFLLFALFSMFEPTLLLFGLTFVAHTLVRLVGFHLSARFVAVGAPLYRVRSITWASANRLAQFSAVQSVGVLATMLLLQGPNLIIGRMLGVAAVSYYQPALLVATQLGALVFGLTSPLLPLAARDRAGNDGRRLGEWSLRFGRLAALFSAFLFLPLLLYARQILTLWMGPAFSETGPVLILVVGAYLLHVSQSANYFLLLGGGRIRGWQISEVVTAPVALAAAVAGQIVFRWGLVGMAGAIAGITAVRNGAYLPLMACRAFGMRRRSYYLNVFARPMSCAAIAGGTATAVSLAWPPDGLVDLAAQLALTWSLFTVAAWFLALDSEDRAIVWRLPILRRLAPAANAAATTTRHP